VASFRANLLSDEPDRAYLAELLRIPSETYISDTLPVIDPDIVHNARELLQAALARALAAEFQAVHERNLDSGVPQLDAGAIGRRALKNLCLGYLAKLDEPRARRLIVGQFETATTMTDSTAALTILGDSNIPERETALAAFYDRWQHEPLVIDKWFSIQSASSRHDTLERVKELTRHGGFNVKNPNRVRAVLGSLTHANPVRFHDRSGEGYELVADWVIKLDTLNPQLAAYLMTGFNHWRRYETKRCGLMKAQIQRILAAPGLSGDVREIGVKSLADSR
jgi:aminopeptidase N